MVCFVIPYDSASSVWVLGVKISELVKTFDKLCWLVPFSNPYQLLRNEKHLPSFTGLVLPKTRWRRLDSSNRTNHRKINVFTFPFWESDITICRMFWTFLSKSISKILEVHSMHDVYNRFIHAMFINSDKSKDHYIWRKSSRWYGVCMWYVGYVIGLC